MLRSAPGNGTITQVRGYGTGDIPETVPATAVARRVTELVNWDMATGVAVPTATSTHQPVDIGPCAFARATESTSVRRPSTSRGHHRSRPNHGSGARSARPPLGRLTRPN